MNNILYVPKGKQWFYACWAAGCIVGGIAGFISLWPDYGGLIILIWGIIWGIATYVIANDRL